MNKQQITKQYGVLMLVLAVISMVILLATAFVPAFEMNLGLIEGSETSMDYLFLPLFEDTSNNTSLDKEDFEFVLLDGLVEKLIMRAAAIFCLGFPILFVLTNKKNFSKLEEPATVSQMCDTVQRGLVVNVAFYAFCMYIILKEHDWDFISALQGDTLITTKTFSPLFIQLIVFAVSMFLYNHWDKALAGKVAPLNLGIAISSQPAQSTQGKQTSQSTMDEKAPSQNARSVQSEMEALELLKKYKELMDNGVITEEEFQAKKEELLTVGHQNIQSSSETETDQTTRETVYEPVIEQEEPAANSNREKEISHTCEKCGYPINPSQQVCPHCSTKVTVQAEAVEHGMKWYKCLIYFILFASAIVNAISSITYFTGAVYGGYAEAVYETYPALRFIDLFGGVLCLALAVFAIMIRSDLVWYRKRGPKRLCTMYVIIGIFNILYPVVLTVITEQNLITAAAAGSFIGGVVMAIINHNYFKKRKDTFKF